jgi:hypothetical protein
LKSPSGVQPCPGVPGAAAHPPASAHPDRGSEAASVVAYCCLASSRADPIPRPGRRKILAGLQVAQLRQPVLVEEAMAVQACAYARVDVLEP